MSLSLEACIHIVRSLGAKEDLALLCRVSRVFRNAAERVLYNTVHMRGVSQTQRMCHTLTTSARLATLVDALTIDITTADSSSESSRTPRSDDFWDSIAHALRGMRRLRFLNISIDDSADMTHAWVLNGCIFQLRTFHCDFSWDESLVAFLNTQHSLTDLYILDFQHSTSDDTLSLPPHSLPKLSILECTFMEAAIATANNRSLSRLKTCFTASGVAGKRLEFMNLVRSLRRSRRNLRALDIADSTYSSDFTLDILTRVRDFLPSWYLRYLGTLCFPATGKKVKWRFP